VRSRPGPARAPRSPRAGSSRASRITAAATRVCPGARPRSPRSARTCPARSVSARPTKARTGKACSGLASGCGPTSRSAVRNAARDSGGPAVPQLEHAAGELDAHRRHGLGLRPDSALGALHPRLGLGQPPRQTSAVPSALQTRPAYVSSVQPCRPARSIAFLLSSAVRGAHRGSSTGARFGVAEADQRQRAQLHVQDRQYRFPGLPGLGRCQQPPCLLRHRRQAAGRSSSFVSGAPSHGHGGDLRPDPV